MTTSVAMCTYNGARFIEEQLRSILNQTKLVGEIIVCDDGSTDKTVNIIQKIAEETTIPIRIYINETNLGCVQNFEKAIHLCQGDLIFLSDQDDIWMFNKVELITRWFERHPHMNVVFGDAFLINEESMPIMNPQVITSKLMNKINSKPMRLWEGIGFSELSQKQFKRGLGLELWMSQNRATGATMALKKTFSEQIKIHHPDFYHDGALSFNALLTCTLGFFKQPLISYRQHKDQTIGCPIKKNIPYGWDDVRVIHKLEIDFISSVEDERIKKRISFVKKRHSLQHSVICMTHWNSWPEYKCLYGRNGLYMYVYDIYKATRYSLKSIISSLK